MEEKDREKRSERERGKKRLNLSLIKMVGKREMVC